jgi:hypothetical protein
MTGTYLNLIRACLSYEIYYLFFADCDTHGKSMFSLVCSHHTVCFYNNLLKQSPHFNKSTLVSKGSNSIHFKKSFEKVDLFQKIDLNVKRIEFDKQTNRSNKSTYLNKSIEMSSAADSPLARHLEKASATGSDDVMHTYSSIFHRVVSIVPSH